MTSVLREWILTLAGAAAVCAVAMTLCPKGRVRRVLSLVCGAVMTVALVSPLLELDMDAYSESLALYREEARRAAQSGTEADDALSRTIIERECAAYILDKAESLGVSGASAEVRARWSGEGCWVPEEATIRASASPEQISRLGDAVTSELGIPYERQFWEAG